MNAGYDQYRGGRNDWGGTHACHTHIRTQTRYVLQHASSPLARPSLNPQNRNCNASTNLLTNASCRAPVCRTSRNIALNICTPAFTSLTYCHICATLPTPQVLILGEDMAAGVAPPPPPPAASQEVVARRGVQVAGRLPVGWGATWILLPCIKCISRCD